MNKKKKIATIVCFCLIAAVLVSGIICYIVIPNQTKNALSVAWEWLNHPLPVVGISIIMLALLIWRFVATSSIGKRQITQFKENVEDTKVEFENLKKRYLEEIANAQKEYEELKVKYEILGEFVKKVCSSIPNKKVKELGEQYETKKEIDNQTKTN